MFKKLMRKLGVSALVAILPVVLMGGVVYAKGGSGDPEDLPLPLVKDNDEPAPVPEPPATPAPVSVPPKDDFSGDESINESSISRTSAEGRFETESNAKENDPRVTKAEANRDAAAEQVSSLESQQKSEIDTAKQLNAAAKESLESAAANRANGNEDAAELLEEEAQRMKDQALSSLDKAGVLEKQIGEAKQELTQAEADLAIAEQRAIDDANNQKQSVLPSTNRTIADCKIIMNKVHMDSTAAKKKFEKRDDVYIKEVLGCGIKTGDISLWMVPYYIRFILEFILQLGGLVAVGGIIYGGYLYLFAGLSDDKDRGKKAIIYGVGGIVLAMTAWALVNIVISVVTA